jgi:hypothetical protein
MGVPLTWNTPGVRWNMTGFTWNMVVPNPPKTKMKIALNLKGKPDKDIIDAAYAVAQALTDNAADFTGISPTAVEIKAAADDAQAAITDQINKQAAAKTATQVKDDAVANIIVVLQKAAGWTESNQTDPNKAGKVFPLKKAATPISSIGQVQALAVTFGDNPGELDAIWQPVAGAVSYELQCFYPATPSVPWAHMDTVSGSKATLYSMPSATTVQVRVRAIGPNNLKGAWSDIAQHLVP